MKGSRLYEWYSSGRWHWAPRATSKGAKMFCGFVVVVFSKRDCLKQKKGWASCQRKNTLTTQWYLEEQRLLLVNMCFFSFGMKRVEAWDQEWVHSLAWPSRVGWAVAEPAGRVVLEETHHLPAHSTAPASCSWFTSVRGSFHWMPPDRHMHHFKQTNKNPS